MTDTPGAKTPTRARVLGRDGRPRLPRLGGLDRVELVWEWPGQKTDTETLRKTTLDRLRQWSGIGDWGSVVRYVEVRSVLDETPCTITVTQERGSSRFTYSQADSWQGVGLDRHT